MTSTSESEKTYSVTIAHPNGYNFFTAYTIVREGANLPPQIESETLETELFQPLDKFLDLSKSQVAWLYFWLFFSLVVLLIFYLTVELFMFLWAMWGAVCIFLIIVVTRHFRFARHVEGMLLDFSNSHMDIVGDIKLDKGWDEFGYPKYEIIFEPLSKEVEVEDQSDTDGSEALEGFEDSSV